jgi:hypothetical protein
MAHEAPLKDWDSSMRRSHQDDFTADPKSSDTEPDTDKTSPSSADEKQLVGQQDAAAKPSHELAVRIRKNRHGRAEPSLDNSIPKSSSVGPLAEVESRILCAT